MGVSDVSDTLLGHTITFSELDIFFTNSNHHHFECEHRKRKIENRKPKTEMNSYLNISDNMSFDICKSAVLMWFVCEPDKSDWYSLWCMNLKANHRKFSNHEPRQI